MRLVSCPNARQVTHRCVTLLPFVFGWNTKKSERVPNAETMKGGKMQSSVTARLFLKRFSQYSY